MTERYFNTNTHVIDLTEDQFASNEFLELSGIDVIAKIPTTEGIYVFSKNTSGNLCCGKFILRDDKIYEGYFKVISPVFDVPFQDIKIFKSFYKEDDFYIIYTEDNNIYVSSYYDRQGIIGSKLLVLENYKLNNINFIKECFFAVVTDLKHSELFLKTERLGEGELKILMLFENDIQRFEANIDELLTYQLNDIPFTDISETNYTCKNLVNNEESFLFFRNTPVLESNTDSINGIFCKDFDTIYTELNKNTENFSLTLRIVPKNTYSSYVTLIEIDNLKIKHNNNTIIFSNGNNNSTYSYIFSNDDVYTITIVSYKIDNLNNSKTYYVYITNKTGIFMSFDYSINNIVKNDSYLIVKCDKIDYLTVQNSCLTERTVKQTHKAFIKALTIPYQKTLLTVTEKDINNYLSLKNTKSQQKANSLIIPSDVVIPSKTYEAFDSDTEKTFWLCENHKLYGRESQNNTIYLESGSYFYNGTSESGTIFAKSGSFIDVNDKNNFLVYKEIDATVVNYGESSVVNYEYLNFDYQNVYQLDNTCGTSSSSVESISADVYFPFIPNMHVDKVIIYSDDSPIFSTTESTSSSISGSNVVDISGFSNIPDNTFEYIINNKIIDDKLRKIYWSTQINFSEQKNFNRHSEAYKKTSAPTFTFEETKDILQNNLLKKNKGKDLTWRLPTLDEINSVDNYKRMLYNFNAAIKYDDLIREQGYYDLEYEFLGNKFESTTLPSFFYVSAEEFYDEYEIYKKLLPGYVMIPGEPVPTIYNIYPQIGLYDLLNENVFFYDHSRNEYIYFSMIYNDMSYVFSPESIQAKRKLDLFNIYYEYLTTGRVGSIFSNIRNTDDDGVVRERMFECYNFARQCNIPLIEKGAHTDTSGFFRCWLGTNINQKNMLSSTEPMYAVDTSFDIVLRARNEAIRRPDNLYDVKRTYTHESTIRLWDTDVRKVTSFTDGIDVVTNDTPNLVDEEDFRFTQNYCHMVISVADYTDEESLLELTETSATTLLPSFDPENPYSSTTTGSTGSTITSSLSAAPFTLLYNDGTKYEVPLYATYSYEIVKTGNVQLTRSNSVGISATNVFHVELYQNQDFDLEPTYNVHHKLNNYDEFNKASYVYLNTDKQDYFGDTVMPVYIDNVEIINNLSSDPTQNIKVCENINQKYNNVPFIVDYNNQLTGVTLWVPMKNFRDKIGLQYNAKTKKLNSSVYTDYDILSNLTYSSEGYFSAYHFNNLTKQNSVLINELAVIDNSELFLIGKTLGVNKIINNEQDNSFFVELDVVVDNIVYINGSFVGTGYNKDRNFITVVSVDGYNWNVSVPTFNRSYNASFCVGLAHVNYNSMDILLVANYLDNYLLKSMDKGVTWFSISKPTNITTSTAGNILFLTSFNNKFFVMCDNGVSISEDGGVTWSAVNNVNTPDFNINVSGNYIWGSKVSSNDLYRFDGTTWTKTTITTLYQDGENSTSSCNGYQWGGALVPAGIGFVATDGTKIICMSQQSSSGTLGLIYSIDNGITWLNTGFEGVPWGQPMRTIEYVNGVWYMYGIYSNEDVWISPNGLTGWTKIEQVNGLGLSKTVSGDNINLSYGVNSIYFSYTGTDEKIIQTHKANTYLREVNSINSFEAPVKYKSANIDVEIDVQDKTNVTSYINNVDSITNFVTKIVNNWKPTTININKIIEKEILVLANLLKDEYTQVLVGITPKTNVNSYYIRAVDEKNISIISSSLNDTDELEWLGVGRINTPFIKTGVTKIKKSGKNIKINFESGFNNTYYRIFVFSPTNSKYYVTSKQKDGFIVESSALVEDEVAWIALNTNQVANGTIRWKEGVPNNQLIADNNQRIVDVINNSNKYTLNFKDLGFPTYSSENDYTVILSVNKNTNVWVSEKNQTSAVIRRSYAGDALDIDYMIIKGNSKWWQGITG